MASGPHRFAHTYVSEYTFTDANVPGIEAGFNFAGKFSFGSISEVVAHQPPISALHPKAAINQLRFSALLSSAIGQKWSLSIAESVYDNCSIKLR
jgi:hypothetical protein